MPTGHTAKLYEGENQSFQDFALGCARSFGALITMRDEPADAPIPESFEPDPDSYYVRAVREDRARLAKLQSMSLEEAAREAEAERDRIIERNREWQAESDARRARYEAMLEKAQAYEPPTPDHVKFKEFMVEQLESSINFDCHDYMSDPLPTTDPEAWLESEIEYTEKALARHLEGVEGEVERARNRSAWVQALRSSLA